MTCAILVCMAYICQDDGKTSMESLIIDVQCQFAL